MTIARTAFALTLTACTRTDALEMSGAEVSAGRPAIHVTPWASAAPPAPAREAEPEPKPERTTDPLVLKLRDVEPGKGFHSCGFELDVAGFPVARDDGWVAYVLEYSPTGSDYRRVSVVFEPSRQPEGMVERTHVSEGVMEFDTLLPDAESSEVACAQYRAMREAELAKLALTMGNASRWRPMQPLPAQHWKATEEFAHDRRETFRRIPATERPVQVAVGHEHLIARIMGSKVFFEVGLGRHSDMLILGMWFEPHTRAGLILFEEIDRSSCSCTCDWDEFGYALVWPQALLDWAAAHPCVPGLDYDEPATCEMSERLR